MQAEPRAEGHKVSLTKLCCWLGIPRRTFYYRPKGNKKPLDKEKVARVKEVIEKFPSYGYRRIAAVLGWNRKVVRICQRKDWQVKKRSKGKRPRARGLISVASRPNERRATDLTRVLCGRDGRCTLAVVVDCAMREVLGWRLARLGNVGYGKGGLGGSSDFSVGSLDRSLGDWRLEAPAVWCLRPGDKR